jgi:16S rRNA (guanine527-N7)-methyltransferase
MSDFETLSSGARAMGIKVENDALEKMLVFRDALLAENEKLNMTSITDPIAFIESHLIDSLTALEFIDEASTLIDVGTGSGLPGVALAIARPDLRVTLLDATAKKLRAIERVLDACGISDVELVEGRAEELGVSSSEHREIYDVAIARALAKMPVLLEYCCGFVKRDGKLIAMKSSNITDELEASKKTSRVLGFTFITVVNRALPITGAGRKLVIYDKKTNTPRIYPRSNNQILGDPMG